MDKAFIIAQGMMSETISKMLDASERSLNPKKQNAETKQPDEKQSVS